MSVAPRTRRTARILAIDEQGAILLMKAHWGRRTRPERWLTPGGGIDPGEDEHTAAVRELFEETGLRVAEVGPQVARRVVSFRLPDGRMSRVDQRFFLLRAEPFDVSPAEWTEEERRVLVEHTGQLPAVLGRILGMVRGPIGDVVADLDAAQARGLGRYFAEAGRIYREAARQIHDPAAAGEGRRP